MTTVLRLKNTTFTGSGFLRVEPFVRSKDLLIGVSLKGGFSQIKSMPKDVYEPKLLTADVKNSNQNQLVTGVELATTDGLGMKFRLHKLDTGYPIKPINWGTDDFTIFVEGAYVGHLDANPDDFVGGVMPTAGTLVDYGSKVSGKGIAVEITRTALLMRIAKSSNSFTIPLPNAGTHYSLFIIKEGNNITVEVPTIGAKETKTLSELGLSGNLALDTGTLSNVVIGKPISISSDIHSAPVEVRRFAMWNSALDSSEIKNQTLDS